MGFFKKLFKRKPGGTMFGNLLRGVSSQVTGGILGSGIGLQQWEQKEAQKAHNQQQIANQQAALNAGKQFGAAINNQSLGGGLSIGEKQTFMDKHGLTVVIGGIVATLATVAMFVFGRR